MVNFVAVRIALIICQPPFERVSSASLSQAQEDAGWSCVEQRPPGFVEPEQKDWTQLSKQKLQDIRAISEENPLAG
jgi:hypothetical protein